MWPPKRLPVYMRPCIRLLSPSHSPTAVLAWQALTTSTMHRVDGPSRRTS